MMCRPWCYTNDRIWTYAATPTAQNLRMSSIISGSHLVLALPKLPQYVGNGSKARQARKVDRKGRETLSENICAGNPEHDLHLPLTTFRVVLLWQISQESSSSTLVCPIFWVLWCHMIACQLCDARLEEEVQSPSSQGCAPTLLDLETRQRERIEWLKEDAEEDLTKKIRCLEHVLEDL